MLLTTIYNSLLHFGSVVLLAIGALLPIVDPLGGAPIYLAMTAFLTHEERARMAKAVAVNSLVMLSILKMVANDGNGFDTSFGVAAYNASVSTTVDTMVTNDVSASLRRASHMPLRALPGSHPGPRPRHG